MESTWIVAFAMLNLQQFFGISFVMGKALMTVIFKMSFILPPEIVI